MRKGACFLFTAGVILSAACATNPVTGKSQVSLLSEAEEAAIGQQQDVEVRREMGVYDDPELQRYVTNIGLDLARTSHRPNLPWTFTVVDIPAINAFALPGGYIYVTRGILAYLDDESELAGVLGHEIGHVTARHAAQAYTRQAEANLALTVLSIFVPSTRPFAQVGAGSLGVLFLKHDREAELEADRLGVEYESAAGWDPSGDAAVSCDPRPRRCLERARRAELAVNASGPGRPRRPGGARRREVRVGDGDQDQSRSVSGTDRRPRLRRQPERRRGARQRVSTSDVAASASSSRTDGT